MFAFPNPFQRPRNPFSGQGIQSLLMPIRNHLTQQQDTSEIDALMEQIGQMITSFPKPLEEANGQPEPFGGETMKPPYDTTNFAQVEPPMKNTPHLDALYGGISGLT